MSQKNLSQSYPNAPIVEAIIDIRVDLLEKTDLNPIAKKLKSEYPLQEKILYETNKIHRSKGKKTKVSTTQENIGYKLTTANEKYVVQIRKNGFTFSTLSNYKSWDIFFKKAMEAWESYQKASPSKITRVAVRYINRIDIPELNFDLEKYFHTFPHVFKDNSAIICGFSMQTFLPQKEGGVAILSQKVTNPISPGYTSVLLDIDVFDLENFDSKNDKKIRERISQLREQKNNIFEKSITDKTRELFS